MILATIEFPNGSQIHLGEDGRWTGDDEVLVSYANNFQHAPLNPQNFIANLAAEIVARIGGKVIFAIQSRPCGPPGAIY